MVRIQHFNVIKTATVAAFIYMILVAIFVIPFVLLVAIAGVSAPGVQAGQTAGGALVFGLFAILGYGLIGWVATAIAAAIYNLVAGWIGGIEIRLEPVAPAAPPPAWMTSGDTPTTPPPSAPAT